jgi:UDP-N-acetylmuramoyl-tripeptide--D-alanyl-D-alanine ligase
MTSIGAEHLEGFGTIDGVLREEMEAVHALPPGGRVYVAQDCEILARAPFPAHVVVERIGFSATSERRGTIEDGPDGVGVRLFDGTHLASKLAFAWQRANLLLAGTVARLEGVASGALSAASATLAPAPLRGERRTIGATTLLVDCYNSNPLSLGEALRDLGGRPGRKAALLGDMRELGTASAEAHETLGALARSCGIGEIVWVGEWAEAFARGYGRTVTSFVKSSDARGAFDRLVAGGGTVLMKASRSVELETLLECAAHG